jgi:hypothetical protein
VSDTWELRDPEFEALRKLEPTKRYQHFLSRVSDWGWVWVLRDGKELARATDEQGRKYVPVWPHERYAEAERIGDWERYVTGDVEVHEFVDGALPELEAAGVHVAVFPVVDNGAWTVTADDLRADLREAFGQYE